MKTESMKHLQQMYQMCSEDMSYFKELIEAIIRIESETKTKSKFKIWDYVLVDAIRPSMACVFHDNGYKVASDSHILIAIKEDYPEEMEGRLMRKDGTLMDEGTRFPKWRDVIPNPELSEMVPVKIDFTKVREFEADFKAKKKASDRKNFDAYIRVRENCAFRLDYLVKMVKAMEHIGTDTLMVNADGWRAALAVGGESKAILMPIRCVDDKELVYTL